MPRSFQFFSLALATLLIFATGNSSALAEFDTTINVSVQAQSGGLYLYTYTVMNLSTSTVNIGEFDVSVDALANLSLITEPTGFLNSYTAGNTFISFQSTDSSFDIMPGTSSVFTFDSKLGAAKASDLVRSYDGSNPQNAGFTLAPSSVPEPASLVLIGFGFVGIHVTRKLRRQSA